MHNFHYHFLKTNKELAAVARQMQDIFDTALQHAVSLTETVETDIVVRHSPQNTIPELGISGQYTKAARCIDIFVNLQNAHFQEHFAAEVARTFTHEYMHVVREEYVLWENGTLLESLVAEGLTQSFEIEVQPELAPSIYATALTTDEVKTWWQKVQEQLEQRGWDNDAWFFGGEGIPRWAGYSLGFKLVQDKIECSGMPPSELYRLPATDFLPSSQ